MIGQINKYSAESTEIPYCKLGRTGGELTEAFANSFYPSLLLDCPGDASADNQVTYSNGV